MAQIEPSEGLIYDAATARAEDLADHTVVWVRGENDAASAPALAETLARAMSRPVDLIVDLSEVCFMDASTLSVIAVAHKNLALCQRRLTVRAPSRVARRLLDLCALSHLIDAGPVRPAVPATDADALRTWVNVPAVFPETKTASEPESIPASYEAK